MTTMTLMMIRGLSRQQAHWGSFPDQLKDALEKEGVKATILFEDLPGFGLRYHQKSPDSIEKIAELLAPTLEKAVKNTQKKIHLLGISMGGMVAVELATRFPDCVASLVLVNASFAGLSPVYRRLQPLAFGSMLKAWFHPSKRESEKTILRLSSPRNQHNEALLSSWLALRERFPPSRIVTLKQLIAASRYRLIPHPPIKDVLLIASKADKLASYHCSEDLAKHWQRALHLHPWAGHDLPLEDGVWLVSQLQEWLLNK